MGPTRSTRLPRQLDDWFKTRLDDEPERSPSDLLVSLIHGGLRLREGYMVIHRRALEHFAETEQTERYAVYCRALLDTFGREYVEHVERWLRAERARRDGGTSSVHSVDS